MATATATTSGRPVAAISRGAAFVSLATAALFVVLLVALHFIKPEFDPSWRFISEYAIGDYGWIMMLAFLSLAGSTAALYLAIRSQISTTDGKIGLICLLISAAGLAIAGLFTTDPITTSHEAVTMRGNLHSLGGTLGLAVPFAAALISWQLARSPAWATARQALRWTGALAVVGFLISFVSVMLMLPSDGQFGPDVLVGWPNRLEIIAYSLWLMTAAWHALKLSKQSL
ncbi:MAG: DUF998 domain-containing protein [Caldilineaceae bacterium]|nr:DUF998 domain-containing protein [Caldilineaceae bacterium]